MAVEPTIKKAPTEIFGHPYSDQTPEKLDHLARQHCPYIGGECKKPRKSESHIKTGICSVGYKGSFQKKIAPVIICPHRLGEPIVFDTIKTHYLAHWPNVEWVKEVGMGDSGNVDYVAVRRDPITTKITDFQCVEFQAGGTTGTPWQAVLDMKQHGSFQSDSYDFGINWANEFIKTMMQQVFKKGQLVSFWNRSIIFVVQESAIEYIKHASDGSDIRGENEHDPIHKDNIHFVTFDMKWNNTKWELTPGGRYSTNVEGVIKILGGANKDKFISEDKFIEFVQRKGSRDGVF